MTRLLDIHGLSEVYSLRWRIILHHSRTFERKIRLSVRSIYRIFLMICNIRLPLGILLSGLVAQFALFVAYDVFTTYRKISFNRVMARTIVEQNNNLKACVDMLIKDLKKPL